MLTIFVHFRAVSNQATDGGQSLYVIDVTREILMYHWQMIC